MILVLWVTAARASTVALVYPSSSTPQVAETVSRLYGELVSLDLDVRRIKRSAASAPNPSDPQAWIHALAGQGKFDAVLSVVGEGESIAVDVWVTESSPEGWRVSRVLLEPKASNAAERLAIRAVEVLRSIFLENDMAARNRHLAPPTRPTIPSLEPPPKPVYPEVTRPSRTRLGGELGMLVLVTPSEIGPAFLPLARLDWSVRPWFVMEAALAGFGSRPTLTGPAGQAQVAYTYSTLGIRAHFRTKKRLQPYLSLATGLLRTAVEGEAHSPGLAHRVDQWSLLLDGSVGAGWSLTNRYFLTLGTHIQLAEPYVAVHFAEAVVATLGRPSLALTLTVGAWL